MNKRQENKTEKEGKLLREAHKLAVELTTQFIEEFAFYKAQNISMYTKNEKGKETTKFTKRFQSLFNLHYPVAYDRLKYMDK